MTLVIAILASLAFFGAGLWASDLFQVQPARGFSADSWLIIAGCMILATIGWCLRAAGCILMAVACQLVTAPDGVSRNDMNCFARRHGNPIVGFVLLGGMALIVSECLLYFSPQNMHINIPTLIISVWVRFAIGQFLKVVAFLCAFVACALAAIPCGCCLFGKPLLILMLVSIMAFTWSDDLLDISQEAPQLVNREFLESLSRTQIAELLKLASSHDVP